MGFSQCYFLYLFQEHWKKSFQMFKKFPESEMLLYAFSQFKVWKDVENRARIKHWHLKLL